MNRTRGRLPIRLATSGCALCGGVDHGTYQHSVAMSELTPADLRRLHDADVDEPASFTGGFRLGALVAGTIALSCGALAIAAQFLR